MHKLANPYNNRLCLPRMSWHPFNLYNLYRRSFGPESVDIRFTRTNKTLFQQTWLSKKLVRGYHGDWIQEHRFQRNLLPVSLPPLVAPSKPTSRGERGGRYGQQDSARQRSVPIGSLMFALLESRLDVLVFRACFAPSVYIARQLVVHGHVKVDGLKANNPNILLKPGQLFQVTPNAIQMLRTRIAAPDRSSETASAEANDSEGASASENSNANKVTQEEKEEGQRLAKISDTNTNLPFHLPDFAAPFIFIPAYLEVSFPTCSAVYVREPTARPGYSEIPTPYDADGEIVRLAWEWYNRVGRRRKVRTPERPGNDFRRYKNTRHIVEPSS